jgi:hypothetical protein
MVSESDESSTALSSWISRYGCLGALGGVEMSRRGASSGYEGGYWTVSSIMGCSSSSSVGPRVTSRTMDILNSVAETSGNC